jgi:hypothetical protein
MNKVKEELKAKEIIKEAEQRRQGNVPLSCLTRHRPITRVQTRSTTRKPKQPSKPRSKQTRKPAPKKLHAKRRSERADRSSMPPPPPP